MTTSHQQAERHDPVYDQLHESPDFTELKRRYQRFVFPATIAFLGWYLLYVLMCNWATDFMGTKLLGNINVALVFGLLQFVDAPSSSPASTPATRTATSTRSPRARAALRRRDGPAAGRPGMSSDTLTAILFLAVVAVTVGITFWASRQTAGTADFYAGGRSFSGFQNGMAISGDYMSAASFLGISGAIALYGYDGFLYSIGFLVAWLVALLLVAELLRNSGRYTMADQLAYRMRQRPVRTAAATSTVVVSIFYLLAQMVGAGALVALLLGVESEGVKALTIVGVGLLMIFYVTVGGMKGTTWVQIVKAVLLMSGTVADHGPGPGGVQLQPLRAARRGRRTTPARARRSSSPACTYGADLTVEDRLPQPRPGAGARHRRPAAHPDPLLHRADRARTRGPRCSGRSA